MAKKLPHWFPVYPSDFLGAVHGWSVAEVGAYWLLILHQLQRGSVPSSRKRLRMLCPGVEDEELEVVLEKFEPSASDPDRLVNARAARIRDEAVMNYIRQVDRTSAARAALAAKRATVTDSATDSVTETATGSTTHNSQLTEEEPQPDKKKTGAEGVEVPERLQVPEFLEKWSEWLEWRRKEKRNSVTPRAAKMQLNKLAKLTIAEAIATIDLSIGNDWIGLFPEKRKNGSGSKAGPRFRSDVSDADREQWAASTKEVT